MHAKQEDINTVNIVCKYFCVDHLLVFCLFVILLLCKFLLLKKIDKNKILQYFYLFLMLLTMKLRKTRRKAKGKKSQEKHKECSEDNLLPLLFKFNEDNTHECRPLLFVNRMINKHWHVFIISTSVVQLATREMKEPI